MKTKLFFAVRVIQYAFLLVFAILLQLFAMIFAPIIALFVDTKTGNLPYLLRWFQTPDATCYDEQWVAEHPQWSKYRIARTWIARNPAYGFRKWIGPKQLDAKKAILYGNKDIADGEHGVAGWFLVIYQDTGHWNFSYVKELKNHKCVRGELGWYLLPLVKGYESVNTGMLQSDPVRFYAFGVKGN